MKRAGLLLAVVALAAAISYGCAGTVYVREDPPPVRVEVRPAAPGPNAMWIDGYWRWGHHEYLWMPGHWERHARGTWVTGHWDKRPRGNVWVPGHWRR